MTRHKYLVLTAVSLAALGLTKASLAAQPDLEKLNLCYSSIAATSVTTWVPHEAGIFKKYGLDVSLIYVAGAHAITTLVSGDARKFYAPAPLAQLNKEGFVKEVYPR